MGCCHEMQRVFDDISAVMEAIFLEAHRGREKHGPFRSCYEIYAVLLEELDEFWDSVKADKPDPQELIQVAAVAMRAVYEMTGGRHE